MPLSVQPKLLRVLQEEEIEKIGGNKCIPVDVRVIVTTNEDLRQLIKDGKFREDLFYRLHVVTIKVPPLRERQEDIPVLADHFIELYSDATGKSIKNVDKDVYKKLRTYAWPGNIRELQNVIERAVNNSSDAVITCSDLGLMGSQSDTLLQRGRGENLIEDVKKRAERKVILDVLKKYDNNKTKAAEYLNIARPLLYKKMKRLGIDK